jgi:hypothetical protein
MSNHSGSYLLNEVFHMMEDANILQHLDPKIRYKFMIDVVNMGAIKYDCNPGEILDVIGECYRICYSCLQECDIAEYGLCKECGQ